MSYVSQSVTTLSRSAKLSDALFQHLRSYVYEKTGIFFADNKKYLLESRINRRLTALGVSNFEAYYRLLTNGQGPTELPHLINTVTINETFFFRNDLQFAALETALIPELIRRRKLEKVDKIKIWSAACSTGEEPYTIAMVIREKIMPRFPTMKFEIVGTDINTQVLDAARKGIYKEYAVRPVPPEYMKRYFEQQEDKYYLDEEIKRMVEFRHVNLIDRIGLRALRGFDIVIAANVLIYFDSNSKLGVISSLYDSMNRGGYLLIGYSETLYGLTQAFKPAHAEKVIAYRKE